MCTRRGVLAIANNTAVTLLQYFLATNLSQAAENKVLFSVIVD